MSRHNLRATCWNLAYASFQAKPYHGQGCLHVVVACAHWQTV
jgi:hypothetical protein